MQRLIDLIQDINNSCGSFSKVVGGGTYVVWPASKSAQEHFHNTMKEKSDQCVGFIDSELHGEKQIFGKNIFSPEEGLAKDVEHVVILSGAFFWPICRQIASIRNDISIIFPIGNEYFCKRQNIQRLSGLKGNADNLNNLIRGVHDNELIAKKIEKVNRIISLCRGREGTYHLSNLSRNRLLRGYVDYLSSNAEDVNFEFNGNEKVILYVSVQAYWTFARESIYVRRRGYKTILLTSNEAYAEGKEDYFDQIIVARNLFALIAIALSADVDIIQIRGWMQSYFVAAIICLLAEVKTVVEFMDIPEFFCDRESYGHLFGEDIAHDDFESFPAIFSKADGLLLNHDGPEIEILKRKYKRINNVIQFHNYVCDEFCANKEVQISKPFSIVYAGTVCPSNHPHPFFGATQLLPLIHKLTEQKMKLHIYMNPVAKVNYLYWDYQYEAKINPFFEIREGRAPYSVTHDLANMHFGLLLFILKDVVVGEEHIGGSLPTKFVLYLEAGLPILVSEKLKYVARLVKEYGIGLVIAEEDIDSLGEVIEACDYATLRENVAIFKNKFNYNYKIASLIGLYEAL